ncbi:HNH endonuclease signature motif containing protein [Oligella urethralis]|uniref:HNH endonuclease signature motif containing protein n=1 Tax=Oligella urethralis TaxID=90245 RepID=UPI00215D8C86|nr:HNH endonuclease signature motif containing protein [Oligella urethralis]
MEKVINVNGKTYVICSSGKVFRETLRKIPIVTKGMRFSGKFLEIQEPRKPLKRILNNRGYLSVKLDKKTKMVHRLIAEAFIPNPENKPYVNHLNGNRLDNRVENLEWCTQQENVHHAFNTGLISEKGRKNSIQALLDNNPNPRLSDSAIEDIRTNFKKRCPVNGANAFAKKYGVSTTTISYVINRRKHYVFY